MSKLETPMTRAYWQSVGGTLIEEFVAVERSSTTQRRVLDGLILPTAETRIANWREPITIDGRDVLVVQTKASRLSMYLMGQALLSPELVRQRFKPSSIRSVLLCTLDDSALHPLLEPFPSIEVIVMPSQVSHPLAHRKVRGAAREYWGRIGGTFVERFPLTERTPSQAAHRAEAIILTGHVTREAQPAEISIEGEDVVVVTSYPGFGMYVCGQAIFSAQLARLLGARSVQSVILAKRDDMAIRRALDGFRDIEILVVGE